MADQDWYAGDVYDDNQYDDDQQQQRQQQLADAAAAPAAPTQTSTQPYPRGAATPRGRGDGARADIALGGRNLSRPTPAPARDLGRGGGQPQSGRDRMKGEPYRGGDNWQQWDGRESSRDYNNVSKEAPPRDFPRDGFREDRSGGFREPHARDIGGRAGFRDAPTPRDAPFRDDARDFHYGRDYKAEPQNFREPPPSGSRQGLAGPRVEARDFSGYRDQHPSQHQHFRDSRDSPQYRDQPHSRDQSFGGRGRGGDMYDGAARSFGQTRDLHDDQHFPRDRRGEPSQPFRESAHGHDHRQSLRDGPNYRDHQSSGFRDHRDYNSHRDSHPMPQQDHRDNSGYRDVTQRFSDAPARHVRDAPNYRDPQSLGHREHREYSSQPITHHKDGLSTAATTDRERERDRVFIPRDRENSDVSAGRQIQDQPPVEHNNRNEPMKTQHHPEGLHSRTQSQSQQLPVKRENVSSNAGNRGVSSAIPPIEQQHRKNDDRPMPSIVRDDVPTSTPVSNSSVGQLEKMERPRFNNSEGRIYLGRVDWNATKNDLVKFCEKYVDPIFLCLVSS